MNSKYRMSYEPMRSFERSGARYWGYLLLVFIFLVTINSGCFSKCLCYKLPGEYGSPNRAYCQDFSTIVNRYITDPESISDKESRLGLAKDLLKLMKSCKSLQCVDNIIQNPANTDLEDLRSKFFALRERNRFDSLSESDRVELIKCGFNTAIKAGVQ